MNVAVVHAVLRKEILEMVRDRRTIISMVLVPILAIPALIGVTTFFTASGRRQAEREAMTIAISERLALPGLEAAMRAAGFQLTVSADPRRLVEAKKSAAAVLLGVSGPDGGPVVRLLVDASRQGSIIAAEKLRTALEQLKVEKVRASLAGSGIPETVLRPFTVERVDVGIRAAPRLELRTDCMHLTNSVYGSQAHPSRP